MRICCNLRTVATRLTAKEPTRLVADTAIKGKSFTTVNAYKRDTSEVADHKSQVVMHISCAPVVLLQTERNWGAYDAATARLCSP